MAKQPASNTGPSEQGRARSEFPKHTLEDSLRVAEAIENANGGQPLPPVETAQAIGISPGSSAFRSLLSASIGYGLTEGSYQADRVLIRPTGQSIVEPKSADDRQRAIVLAALTPTTFKRIYDHYRGKKMPEGMFFENTVVRDFSVPREHAKVCVSIFTENMKFAGLVRDTKGGSWLTSDAAAAVIAGEAPEAELQPPAPSAEGRAPGGNGATPAVPEKPVHNAIFVGHGKNTKPLEQLKQILDQYHIPHKVAVDEANRGRPVSEKVADTMHECGAAILIFTADEQFKDAEGNPVWRPSDNVVYELGAASVLYGRKIIIFKEEGIDFATNFRDIGYISFEKDALANKTNELFKELISFGLIKVTVGA